LNLVKGKKGKGNFLILGASLKEKENIPSFKLESNLPAHSLAHVAKDSFSASATIK
jgi:hypothetical protein